MADKDVLEQKIKAKLSALDAKIQDLRAQVMDATDGASEGARSALVSAEDKRNEAANMLTEIRETAEDAWDESRERFESFVNSMDDDDSRETTHSA